MGQRLCNRRQWCVWRNINISYLVCPSGSVSFLSPFFRAHRAREGKERLEAWKDCWIFVSQRSRNLSAGRKTAEFFLWRGGQEKKGKRTHRQKKHGGFENSALPNKPASTNWRREDTRGRRGNGTDTAILINTMNYSISVTAVVSVALFSCCSPLHARSFVSPRPPPQKTRQDKPRHFTPG